MRWKDHRALLVALLAMGVLGLYERQTPGMGSLVGDRPPRSLLDPDRNIADVYAELYPGRTSSLYYRALQATLCLQAPPRRRSSVCRSYDLRNTEEVRSLFAGAVDAGRRSNERVLYNYMLLLALEGAPDEKLDPIIRRWRIDYPYSTLPDPRAAARRR